MEGKAVHYNKYQVIVADPPWSFSDSLKMSDVKRGAESNYSTMTIDEIKSLPISNLADQDGCLLALWVPSSLLQQGLDTMLAWGFTQKQTYIWAKTKIEPLDFFKKTISQLIKKPDIVYDKPAYTRIIKSITETIKNVSLNTTQNILSFGMGRLFRQSHEICLIGINNNGIYKLLTNKSQRSVSFAPNLKHSSKPDVLQDSLDIMFKDVPNKIELFARRARKGWVCVGNQSPYTENEDIRESLSKLI
jgi:N6-adenosine-specific RNA methylase IME4